MPEQTVTFSSYPASVTFDSDGGYMQHTSDETKVEIPSRAIAAGDQVTVQIARPDLDDALPATTPGDTFTKVGPEGGTDWGRKITAVKSGTDYTFVKAIAITMGKSGTANTVEANGAVDPSSWHPRDGAPWNDGIDVYRNKVTFSTTRVGRPYATGDPNSQYFVVANT